MKRQYNHLYKSLYVIGAVLIGLMLLPPTFRGIPVDAQSTLSSTDASKETPLDLRIAAFFNTLKRGDAPLAFEELLRQSLLSSSSADSQITELQSQVDDLRKGFGDILNWEKYETKRMGEDIVVIQYILKYEQCPVIWSFAFYRKPASTPSMTMPPSNLWVLLELRFDTKIL